MLYIICFLDNHFSLLYETCVIKLYFIQKKSIGIIDSLLIYKHYVRKNIT